MLLAIDIGNTNITLGIFKTPYDGIKPATRGKISSAGNSSVLLSSWRLSTASQSTADEYGTKILDLLHYASIERAEIKAVAIASVVPPLNSVFSELTEKYFHLKAQIVGENLKIPIANLTENPKEVGTDRLVNTMAAIQKFGGPAIVIDFGTAATFDCITKKGEYAGGIIVPGPILAAESLSLHTAKLPKVQLAKPQALIGKNTVESIQSGLYHGYIALVDGLIERLKKEMGANTKIIVTGGLASLLVADSKMIRPESIVPDLTLEGIYLVWEKNQ